MKQRSLSFRSPSGKEWDHLLLVTIIPRKNNNNTYNLFDTATHVDTVLIFIILR